LYDEDIAVNLAMGRALEKLGRELRHDAEKKVKQADREARERFAAENPMVTLDEMERLTSRPLSSWQGRLVSWLYQTAGR
jgi:uncharacterized protein YukE